ncbi:hypothetical protein, partial [Acidisphaera sp. L21]
DPGKQTRPALDFFQ